MTNRRFSPFAAAALAAAFALPAAVASAAPAATQPAPLAPITIPETDAIEGSYLLFLGQDNDETSKLETLTADVSAELRNKGLEVTSEMPTLGTIAVKATSSSIDKARSIDGVTEVVMDQKVELPKELDTDVKPKKDVVAEDGLPEGRSSSAQTWGLDRINQRDLPLDGNDFNSPDGRGVTAYVIDSGVDISHPEFEGRASYGWDAVDEDYNADDVDIHGTHVAGTIAGKSYGVAPEANIVAVRVLGPQGGTGQDYLEGVNWVANNHKSPAVANISIHFNYNSAMNRATARLVNSGVTVAVSANNQGIDACRTSPASEGSVISVGATDRWDNLVNFSNYGRCVDINAPGSDVRSSVPGGRYHTLSGTSMAAPHVAGAAALYLSQNRYASPREVASALVNNASHPGLNNLRGTADNMLYTGFIGASSPEPEPVRPEPTQPVRDGNKEFETLQDIPLNDDAAHMDVTSTYTGARRALFAVSVQHDCLQELEVSVTSPDGYRSVLKRRDYSWRCDIWDGWHDYENNSVRGASNGTWHFDVIDKSLGNTGTLRGAYIKFD